MSKILLINGSPNEHGCVDAALGEIAAALDKIRKPRQSLGFASLFADRYRVVSHLLNCISHIHSLPSAY